MRVNKNVLLPTVVLLWAIFVENTDHQLTPVDHLRLGHRRVKTL